MFHPSTKVDIRESGATSLVLVLVAMDLYNGTSIFTNTILIRSNPEVTPTAVDTATCARTNYSSLPYADCNKLLLAVVDLLMAIVNGAPNFIFLVTAHWPFGSVICTPSNFTANLTVSAGEFTLVAIIVDRYVLIVKPLQHRLSRSIAGADLFTVWFASVPLTLPTVLYSDT